MRADGEKLFTTFAQNHILVLNFGSKVGKIDKIDKKNENLQILPNYS